MQRKIKNKNQDEVAIQKNIFLCPSANISFTTCQGMFK